MRSNYFLLPCTALLILFDRSSAGGCNHNLKSHGVPRIEERVCPINTTALNGTSVFCGTLVVLERSHIYRGRTIQLPMLRICPNNHSGLKGHTSPVVYVHGGPGITLLKNFNSTVADHFFDIAVSSGRDVILFDERGSIITKPVLNCSESFPLTRQCVREIKKQGIDLSTYNTRNNANDIDDLRKSVRARKINVYGSSYGTILSQAYARGFRRRIRSMLLTGSTWPSFDLFLQNSPKSFELVVGRAIRDCKRDFNCSRKFPNLQNDFDKLLDLPLGKEEPFGNVLDMFSVTRRSVLLDLSLVIRTLAITESFSYTPIHISAYAEFIRSGGKNSTARQILKKVNEIAIKFVSASDPRINPITLQTVNCYDHQGLLSDSVEERVNGGLKSRVPLTFDTPKERRSLCKLLPPLNPPINTAFFRHNIPTLLLSGTYDLQTPTEASRVIAKSLDNATLIEFTGIGHGPIVESPCAVEHYVKFLRHPDGNRFKPLSCLRDIKPKFILDLVGS